MVFLDLLLIVLLIFVFMGFILLFIKDIKLKYDDDCVIIVFVWCLVIGCVVGKWLISNLIFLWRIIFFFEVVK